MRFLALLLIGFGYSALSAAAAERADLDAAFDKDVLIIESSRFACYLFDIYLATSDEQQRRGLMFVRQLPRFTGMLFVYADTRRHSMWMKNTFIPLDIAFARADGTIANIAHDTEPQSLQTIPSAEPVNYVLELNAGITKELFIDENSRILWGPVLNP